MATLYRTLPVLDLLWQDTFPGDLLVCVVLYLGIGIRGHLRSGETARQIGFRFDNAVPATGQAFLYVGPLILITVLFGLMLGTTDITPSWRR